MVGYTNRTSNTGENLHGIAWTASQFIALGAKNTILTSPDGVTWTVRPPIPVIDVREYVTKSDLRAPV